MKKIKRFTILAAVLAMLFAMSVPAFAADDDANLIATETTTTAAADNSTGMKAVGAGIAISMAAGLGALGMGIAVGKSGEAIGRQPEASGKIQGQLMLGLVFIETAIIYALIVCILVIFVL